MENLISTIPFKTEFVAAWDHFLDEWKRYLAPFLCLGIFQCLLSAIPGVGGAFVFFIGIPISLIFWVGFYRKYRADRENKTLSLGTLIDQLGEDWQVILMASLAMYIRIFAAGFWILYPSFRKAGELGLVPQALAYDRSRQCNACEVSETVLSGQPKAAKGFDGLAEGWQIAIVVSIYWFAVILFGLILKWIFPALIGLILNVGLSALAAIFYGTFMFEIWTARSQRADSVPIAANHRWDARTYWEDSAALIPKALGTFLVFVVALGIAIFSGVEVLIHAVK